MDTKGKKKLFPNQHISFCSTPRNSSSARLRQNSRASTSTSRIAKIRSSSLICLLAVIVTSRENRSTFMPILCRVMYGLSWKNLLDQFKTWVGDSNNENRV